jgi:hypothetical protein
MFYDEQPVYHDPPSNQWFGFQAWSMERVAEYYYLTGDAKAKPCSTSGSPGRSPTPRRPHGTSRSRHAGLVRRKPDTWNPSSPAANTGLHVTVTEHRPPTSAWRGLAKAAHLLRAKSGNNAAAKTLAKNLLDGIWAHKDTKGVAVAETRADYNRFDDAASIAADTYTWKNARIDGGGFVPGIVFNRSEKNLAYARTDIGGAYRWQESSKSWTPLLDSVGWDRWGHTGVVSLASDAVAPSKVYAAVGTYTNSWDPGNGAVLRSSDRGATWQKADLPFKLGGNMPGRGMGERLAVDPHKNSVLYLGAPSGKGLWRSTDSGATWSQVTNFPNVGNYVQDPTDTSGYASDNQGIAWVTFDESTGTGTNATGTLYVGVADKENAVYRSTDAGATWSRLAGQPTGYLAHKGVLDAANGYLYLAYSDKGGPYDGGKGQLWRYATATGTWTNISPVAEADTYYGFSGLTVDRQKPGTVMATAYSSWWPDTQIFRSTDSGGTWTKAWDYTSYPNRSNRYTMDVSSSPWLSWGANPSPPEQAPKLGWMTEALEIDPFNSARMMYGTGATVYGTENLSQWDSGGQFTIKPMVQGLEETAVNDLAAPPSGGAQLLSALGDIGGFRHTDLTKVPR